MRCPRAEPACSWLPSLTAAPGDIEKDVFQRGAVVALHDALGTIVVLDPADDSSGDPVLVELVKAMAVAGFAAGNIMLFSVSVWSGANDATRASAFE